MKLLALVVALLLALPASAQQAQPPKGIEEEQLEKMHMRLYIIELERELSFYREREIKVQRDQLQKKLEEQKSAKEKETK